MQDKNSQKHHGFVPAVKDLMHALAQRYHKVIQIIDDALNSESLKDRSWAVDIILKRITAAEKITTAPAKKSASSKMDDVDLSTLDNATLLTFIRDSLKAPGAENEPETGDEEDEDAAEA